MKPPIDFWFDFSSPYSYIANEWVDALAARHGRTVRRHAILLGVTFAAAELKSPVSHPIKREYSLRDFARSARFEGLPYGSEDFYTGQILASVIGGGMSSRLFQEIREKRGWAYSVYSFASQLAETGQTGGLFIDGGSHNRIDFLL